MDTPLINPARLFFTVAVGLGMSQPLPVRVGGRDLSVNINRALAVKNRVFALNPEVISSAWLSFAVSGTNRPPSGTLISAGINPSSLMLAWTLEVTARGGIDPDRYTCSAEQLHMRINATAPTEAPKTRCG